LIVGGFRSGRIHILDTADERAPKLHKVIEPEEIMARTNLSAPHTVHCLANGQIMLSMLGDADKNGPDGFLLAAW
jgi:selenium-binding protein 1